MSGTRDLAEAIHRTAAQHARRHEFHRQLGVVKRLKPLSVDPTDLTYMLDEDDVELSQWVRAYKENTGLQIGDNLVLEYISGHWVAVDVISDKQRPLKVKRRKKGKAKGGGGGEGGEEADTTETEYDTDTEQAEDQEAEEKEEAALESALAIPLEGIGIIEHGEDEHMARPTKMKNYVWVGTKRPLNALKTDFWAKPS